MRSPQECDLGKRDFIFHKLPLLVGGIVLLASGCEVPKVKDLAAPPKKERKENPEPGDVIIIDDKPYLLRNERHYPIPDLERYKRYTKFDLYGRRLFSPPASTFEKYPLGEVSKLPTILDPFAGNIKYNKPLGGEMNVYFAGFMSDGGEIYETIRPAEDAFVKIREDLETKNWEPFETLFFTYGEKSIEKGFAEYKARDTARQPEGNIQHALEFFRILKEQWPLVQFNLLAHSLGTIFALEIAKRHYDAINNLILINGPVRGLRRGIWRLIGLQAFRGYARFKGVEEERVSDYLFNLWENKTHQRELENFVSSFTSIGRKIMVVVDEADPIVPPESSSIRGAKEIRLAKEEHKEGLINLPELLAAHGRSLKDKRVIQHIIEAIGEDRTKAT